jgi:UDP-glucose 4-epimerase
MTPLVVTGAAGFLGRAIVAAARKAGHPVRAVVRRADQALPEWDDGVNCHVADLARDGDMAPIMDGAGAVIHAAAGQNHVRDTAQATQHLLGALSGQRLVLVSSFSVYGFAAMPAGAQLDETTPIDPDIIRRDGYARAKLAQERAALRLAQHGGLDLWILRPGAIYGPGRTWTARLGYPMAGRVLCPGGSARVPAVHVDHCATAVVAAATADHGPWPSDAPILAGAGHVRIVNLVDPDPPTQADWLAAIRRGSIVRVPLGPLMKMARLVDLAGEVMPILGRRQPTGLREPVLAARFKPLRYSYARATDLLGHRPARSFAVAMTAATDTKEDTT